jgi:L-ascorbate metabolism protein UlaG (beta-lactamase superfamily)
VLDLRDTVEELTVVMGWDDPESGAVVVAPDGEWVDVSGAKVFTLHHAFDGIPEGFFIVRSGGLTIYHSGDHGTWSDPPNEAFRTNIDRLAAAAETIDIAFISSFGTGGTRQGINAGDVYGIETLRPRVTFPMHCGDCEDRYEAFAREAARLDLPTLIGVADAPGKLFRYRDGGLH